MTETLRAEQAILRQAVRRFAETEVVPGLAEWEAAGEVPRSLHRRAAEAGILGAAFPEAVGGGGGDLLTSMLVTEELIRAGASSAAPPSLRTASRSRTSSPPGIPSRSSAGSGRRSPAA